MLQPRCTHHEFPSISAGANYSTLAWRQLQGTEIGLLSKRRSPTYSCTGFRGSCRFLPSTPTSQSEKELQFSQAAHCGCIMQPPQQWDITPSWCSLPSLFDWAAEILVPASSLCAVLEKEVWNDSQESCLPHCTKCRLGVVKDPFLFASTPSPEVNMLNSPPFAPWRSWSQQQNPSPCETWKMELKQSSITEHKRNLSW